MCGILAFIGTPPEPLAVTEALELIRHRGQDGLGVWHCRETQDGFSTAHFRQTRRGTTEAVGNFLGEGHMIFIAHWRYATRGGSRLEDIHPVLIDGGDAAIAHNGQFQLSPHHRDDPVSDTLLFARRVESQKSLRLGDRILAAVDNVGGAFALVAADRSGLTTARDRFAIRPLFWSRYRGGVAFSSETPALERLGCREIDEIEPGSVIDWSQSGCSAVRRLPAAARASCSFEHIYFHAADGQLDGGSVRALRHRLGRRLAHECPAQGDVVVPVPKSGDAFAQGYACELGLPLEPAISLSADAARTFIQDAATRAAAIRRKYLVTPSAVEARSVIVVDDSVVRGATLKYLAQQLRSAGAREVHACIGSPQFAHPCFFGIDVPDRKDLICEGKALTDVSRLLDLDSIGFLSLAGLHRVLGDDICTGCFSGRYPDGSLLPRHAREPFGSKVRAAMAAGGGIGLAAQGKDAGSPPAADDGLIRWTNSR